MSATISPEKLTKEPSSLGQHKTEIPPYHLTLLHLITGQWLNVNDRDERRCNSQFIGGNINLSLICALLFTTYLPLLYEEVSRISIPEDGLTVDIFSGYVNSLEPIKLGKDDIHDIFDCSYLVAVAGTLFGTMVSVFYMLAANEATTDSKTYVLLHYLGPQMAVLPFYFFSIGIIGWAIGGYLQVTLVPRTALGFWCKQILLGMLILIMMLVCYPKMIQGTYAGKVEEEANPPMYVSDEEINAKLDVLFANPNSDGDKTLHHFLQSLRRLTPARYRVPLQIVSELRATSMYYRRLAVLSDLSYDDVKSFMESRES